MHAVFDRVFVFAIRVVTVIVVTGAAGSPIRMGQLLATTGKVSASQ